MWGEFIESAHDIPETHAFSVELRLRRADGVEEVHALAFEEHDHAHMNLGDEDDAHARAHAADIGDRFAGRPVTTWQIIVFGLTGGLIPCPAAITVLLICMQLKAFSLGFVLVLCFSIGLALTLVSAGVLARRAPLCLRRPDPDGRPLYRLARLAWPRVGARPIGGQRRAGSDPHVMRRTAARRCRPPCR